MDTQALRLFNCCTHGRAPDWSTFVALRLGGCIDHSGHTEGLVRADRAQFFTVYGIDAEGMAEAITDTDTGATLEEARAVLAELVALSGLPGEECPFMEAPPAAPAVVRTYTPARPLVDWSAMPVLMVRAQAKRAAVPDDPSPTRDVLVAVGVGALLTGLFLFAPVIVRALFHAVQGA